MAEIVVNGKVVELIEDIEKGEYELDLMNHELLEDTIDLSDAVIEAANLFDNTINDMERVNYE